MAKTKKICMVGDFGVGKTSLIRMFVDRQFDDQYLSTVGVKISRTQLNPELKLLIWDIEGQTKFKKIAASYLKGASGMLIIADATRPETVDSFAEHINLCLQVNSQAQLILAINKSDLTTEEELNLLSHGANKFLASNQDNVIQVYTTSAKTGQDVDVIFHQLGERISL
jgi:small GTP-binding protein